jgi:RNA-directed DNA polymerase
MGETQSSQTVSTKTQRIAELARNRPGIALTTLAHHIDVDWLREAYRRTSKSGAAGVDGVTAEQYEQNLEQNLEGLLQRMKSNTYRASPVRRVHIPKGKGQTRPLGIPTFEDRVLQRALVMLLEPIYEQEFLDCSYGFRPGRSTRGALTALRNTMMQMHGGWVLEVDIAKFYDSIDREKLREVVRQRVQDGVVVRLIGKWLNAGVMEDGCRMDPETGTPQGGVISPLLANVFLHEVIDTWFERDIKPVLRGRAALVRYADDMALVFKREQDAIEVQRLLGERLEKYGLTLHPEKTRIVAFQQPKDEENKPDGKTSGTFELLGFEHRWMRSRNGYWVIQLVTAPKRLQGAVARITQWCRQHRHDSVEAQWRVLTHKLRGHYGYYGVTGNSRAIGQFAFLVYRIWRGWLNRRSQRARVTWGAMRQLVQRYPLPSPVIQWSAR